MQDAGLVRRASLLGLHPMIRVLLILVLLAPFGLAFETEVRPLLDAYCVECHGAEFQKGKLRLDGPVSPELWVRVYDRILAGEMPPDKADAPPKAERERALGSLRDGLHAAGLEKQRSQGRSPLRRLNTTQYENSLSRLLGVTARVRDILPEDNRAGGFDNVGTVLDLSPTHLLKYQDAAERAVMSVLPKHPHLPVGERRTGREISQKGSNFQQTLTRSCYLRGDTLVVYSALPRFGLVCTPHVPGAGRYKVRMSAGAVGAANVPVPVAICTIDRGREPPVVRDTIDLAPGEPRLVETEIELEAGEALVVQLQLLWDIRATKRPIEEYTGPGFQLEWLEIEGPVNPFPSAAYRQLFGDAECMPRSVAKAVAQGRTPPDWSNRTNIYQWLNDPLEPVSSSPKADAERLLRTFVPRAFRGPVDEPTIQRFVAPVLQKIDAGESFANALVFGYKSVLSAPRFLFFDETPGPLNRFALANRLAYFLTSGPPDEELLAADLTQPGASRAQAERLLQSPHVQGFILDFTGQWLELRGIAATIPDPNLYGDFDGTLLWAMPEETRRFFEEILRDNRSVLEFVDADWSVLNRRLAAHYGLEEAFNKAVPSPRAVGAFDCTAPQSEFRRVTLPAGSHRGGVLTQGSVLKVTADGTSTSPVLRGKWVLEHIVGRPTPPPPPDVPAIEPDIRGATTIRQQLEKHRTQASCNACHQHIDPPGFALECFDPIGGYRQFYRASARTKGGLVQLPGYTGRAFYRGPDVETGGVTHDGNAFEDVDHYKRLLLSAPAQITRSLAGKLLTYATGAEPQFADREVIEEIVRRTAAANYGLRTLVHEVVDSRPFRNK
jgi:hypothetical protein